MTDFFAGLLRAAGLLLLCAGQPVLGQGSQVGVVPVRPMQSQTREQWVPGKPSATGCIDVARIGGAVVMDPRTVDVVMRGGQRWRLTLAQQCPQLSYYGGFYYQPTQPGKFCAGKDRIMGRAGGPCRVMSISKMRKVSAR
ncbi:hypothetical protein [Sandaracinobacteroides hominis]|uniref:hypothetical protein n=1 Tax=Sandaracinobacteroides hominis TaxID=2780086 RepID=UPI0018F478D6|nr:hypothetical protein [Sandaracinobacteroides hominis]